ncbi:Hypothetical protein GbCGDNIH6_5026 [Granulibacter bethesdensis]|nr:Hypothetical protein GbCGDNIH6_5026 [Granulibacter bethesdensis]
MSASPPFFRDRKRWGGWHGPSDGIQDRLRPRRMRTALLIVVALGLVAAGGIFVGLGMFPPQPHVAAVQKTLPNDRFDHH